MVTSRREVRYDQYYWVNVFARSNTNGDGGRIECGITSSTTASSVDDNGQSVTPLQQRPSKFIQAAFMNQFENLSNVLSHYMTTGPEIYRQLQGNLDAFVMSAGTGGTLVGVGGYLKETMVQQ